MARCAWIAAILLPAAIGVVLEWLKEPASTFSLSVWAIVALTIILALAALLYIIGKHARQLEERAETKLTILTGEDGVYRWENRQANFQEVEYRFGVKNTSESRSIENVRVVLELVKDPNDKNSMSAHRQLFSVENDQAEKTLNPKEVAHYNLVYCNKIPTSKKMNSRMRFGRSKSGAGTEVPAGAAGQASAPRHSLGRL